MTSRTTGYFHVSPKSDEESFFEDVNILRHDGLAVAVAVHNGDITPEEVKGNALMFAAAPEMLAICKDIEGFLKRSGYDTKLVRSVIDKAEGRS